MFTKKEEEPKKKEEEKDVGADLASAQAGKFNPKWLDNLKFHTAEDKIIEKNGRKVHQAVPIERPLKENDLLGWKDYGDKIVIATKDGRKYHIKK